MYIVPRLPHYLELQKWREQYLFLLKKNIKKKEKYIVPRLPHNLEPRKWREHHLLLLRKSVFVLWY